MSVPTLVNICIKKLLYEDYLYFCEYIKSDHVIDVNEYLLGVFVDYINSNYALDFFKLIYDHRLDIKLGITILKKVHDNAIFCKNAIQYMAFHPDISKIDTVFKNDPKIIDGFKCSWSTYDDEHGCPVLIEMTWELFLKNNKYTVSRYHFEDWTEPIDKAYEESCDNIVKECTKQLTNLNSNYLDPSMDYYQQMIIVSKLNIINVL